MNKKMFLLNTKNEKKDVLMIRITSKTISPSVRELLSYATSEVKIDQEYEQYVL